MSASAWTLSSYYPLPLSRSLAADDPRRLYLGDEPSLDPIPLILLSCLLHLAIFFFFPLSSFLTFTPPKEKPTSHVVLRNYIASTFHAAACSLFILVWYFFYDRDLSVPARTHGGGLSEAGDGWSAYLVAFSIGYFLYDTLAMLLYKELALPSSFIHHLVIGTCLLSAYYTSAGHHAQFLMLLEELSTPFLNLKTLFKYHPKLRRASEFCFFFLFLGSRLGYGSWVYLQTLLLAPTTISIMLKQGDTFSACALTFQLSMCFITRVLNVYWAFLIFSKAFGGGKKKKIVIPIEKMD